MNPLHPTQGEKGKDDLLPSQPCGEGPSDLEAGRNAVEPAAVRTFSVSVETRRSNIASLLDDERTVIIHAGPITARTANGSRISMGFPVLAVTGWIADPEAFAAKVAALLQEAQP